MPHRLTFAVWKKSMSLRFAFESLIFFAVLIVFQYDISLFNKDLHLSMQELRSFNLFKVEIIRKEDLPTSLKMTADRAARPDEGGHRRSLEEVLEVESSAELASWTLTELHQAKDTIHEELSHELHLAGAEI